MSTRLTARRFPSGAGDLDWLSVLRVYLAASGILHVSWEVLQLPLYTIWRTGTAREITFAVLHRTAGDIMIATLVLVTALVAVGSAAWPESRFRPVAATVVCLGAGYAVYSDWINTVVRKSWAYAVVMLTLPLLGIRL